MSAAQFPDYSTPIINGIQEVTSHHLGRGIVNAFRKCFQLTGGQIRDGDYLFGRSRNLLRQYYTLLPLRDQDNISWILQQTKEAKANVEGATGSKRLRYSLAKEYKQLAEHLFIVVDTASRRADVQSLMDQIAEANSRRPPAVGISSTISDPFSDSHETSSLSDVDVSNLDQVEMSVFRSETTGDAAVILELHGRDGTTQEVAATIPFASVAGDRIPEGADARTVYSMDTGHRMFGPPSDAGSDLGQ